MHHLTFSLFLHSTMQINLKHRLELMTLYMCQAFVILVWFGGGQQKHTTIKKREIAAVLLLSNGEWHGNFAYLMMNLSVR